MVSVELQRPRRSDALPEIVTYEDMGCEFHPRCLTCPFDTCRFDTHLMGGKEWHERRRAARALQLKAEGRSVDEIAAEVRCSRRSVFRYLAAAR